MRLCAASEPKLADLHLCGPFITRIEPPAPPPRRFRCRRLDTCAGAHHAHKWDRRDPCQTARSVEQIMAISDYWPRHGGGTMKAALQHYQARMRRVLDHIDRHLDAGLDLDTLSAVAAFSKFH